MLAPICDLPVGRRGTVSLKPNEIEAIFADTSDAAFDSVIKDFRRRMNVPFLMPDSRSQEATLNFG